MFFCFFNDGWELPIILYVAFISIGCIVINCFNGYVVCCVDVSLSTIVMVGEVFDNSIFLFNLTILFGFFFL